MALLTDPRVRNFWDPHELLGRAYGQTLPTPGPAWDDYLVFRKGVRWTGKAPPAPDYWMHQLGGVTNAPHLDPIVLRERVEQLLGT